MIRATFLTGSQMTSERARDFKNSLAIAVTLRCQLAITREFSGERALIEPRVFVTWTTRTISVYWTSPYQLKSQMNHSLFANLASVGTSRPLSVDGARFQRVSSPPARLWMIQPYETTTVVLVLSVWEKQRVCPSLLPAP